MFTIKCYTINNIIFIITYKTFFEIFYVYINNVYIPFKSKAKTKKKKIPIRNYMNKANKKCTRLSMSNSKKKIIHLNQK